VQISCSETHLRIRRVLATSVNMTIVPIMSPPEAITQATVLSSEGITKQMNNISIEPLDASAGSAVAPSTGHTGRKILRRDSMDRREALLKGKEGSRQRRRWENGIVTLVGDDCAS